MKENFWVITPLLQQTILSKICFSWKMRRKMIKKATPMYLSNVQKSLLHYLVSSSSEAISIAKCRVLVYGSPEVQYCNDCL